MQILRSHPKPTESKIERVGGQGWREGRASNVLASQVILKRSMALDELFKKKKKIKNKKLIQNVYNLFYIAQNCLLKLKLKFYLKICKYLYQFIIHCYVTLSYKYCLCKDVKFLLYII